MSTVKKFDSSSPGVAVVKPVSAPVETTTQPHSDVAPGLDGLDEKMSSLAWFPWYPKDWITAVAVSHMNDAQIVAYFQLLNWQWLCPNGILPDELHVLSKYTGKDMTTPDMKIVLEKFPKCSHGRANKRLLEVYVKQQDRHIKRVNAGRKARSNADSNASSNAVACAYGSDSGSDSVLQGESRGGFTLQQCRASAEVIGMTAAQVEAFYNHFDSVGWMGTHNRPICNLPSALAKWKAQESNFAQPSKGTVEKKTWPPELDDYVRQMKSEHTLVLAGKKEYGDFDRILTKVRNIFGKECVKEVRRRVGML